MKDLLNGGYRRLELKHYLAMENAYKTVIDEKNQIIAALQVELDRLALENRRLMAAAEDDGK